MKKLLIIAEHKDKYGEFYSMESLPDNSFLVHHTDYKGRYTGRAFNNIEEAHKLWNNISEICEPLYIEKKGIKDIEGY